MFKSQISHLYFCVHKPVAKVEQIDGELARYKKGNASTVDDTFVDAESIHVWDGVPKK